MSAAILSAPAFWAPADRLRLLAMTAIGAVRLALERRRAAGEAPGDSPSLADHLDDAFDGLGEISGW